MAPRWEHFQHGADIGVRGIGETKEEAFEQAALALVAVVLDTGEVAPRDSITVACEAEDDELLLVDWLNAIVYEIATTRRLFCRFEVRIQGGKLVGTALGEPMDAVRHRAAVEVKGATYTELKVGPNAGGEWVAQCIVDV